MRLRSLTKSNADLCKRELAERSRRQKKLINGNQWFQIDWFGSCSSKP